jgi:hypothetical protein
MLCADNMPKARDGGILGATQPVNASVCRIQHYLYGATTSSVVTKTVVSFVLGLSADAARHSGTRDSPTVLAAVVGRPSGTGGPTLMPLSYPLGGKGEVV